MSAIDIVKARQAPVEIVPTRKAGSKLLMNLIYFIDHQKFPGHFKDVETEPSLRWVVESKLSRKEDGVKITTFRNPYDRFAAFYFENVYLDGPYQWTQWRAALQSLEFNYEESLSVEEHQKNAQILFDFMQDKIARNGVYDVATPYAAQVKTILPALDQGFEVLIYARLNFELSERLEPYIPNVDKKITRLFKELAYQLPFHSREIITEPLAKQIRETYAIDFDFFEAMRYGTT